MRNPSPLIPHLPSGYTFTRDFNVSDLIDITKALRSTPWATNITESDVTTAFTHSVAMGIRRKSDNRLVGFVRAVTDYAVFGYLTDFFVAEDERSRGLASALIAELLASDALRGITHLTLIASKPSIEALASAHGFQKTDWQSAWLERLRE